MIERQLKSCWIITEGIAGTENQCIGVAEALGVTPVIKRTSLTGPWRLLSPYLKFEMKASFTGDPLLPDVSKDEYWPDLILAGGRKSIAACRFIKKHSPKTTIVFFQNPRTKDKAFDLITAPRHDKLSGQNVIVTDGAPNRISAELLAAAKQDYKDTLGTLSGPKVAVLLGGNSKHHTYTEKHNQQITEQLSTLSKKGYSLMITASRRTGVKNRKRLQSLLQSRITDKSKLFIWDETPPNPYFGFLSHADYILVTEDSVSMVSEAASTGKPVYLIKLDGHSDKIDSFHAHLQRQNIIKTFDGELENYTYPPLGDSKRIADEILSRFF